MRFSTLAAVSAAALASSVAAHPLGGYDYDVATRREAETGVPDPHNGRGKRSMTDEELFVHAADGVPAVRPKYTPPPGVATPHNDPRKRLIMRSSPPHDVPRPPTPPSPPHVSKGEWPITVDELVARAGTGVTAPGPINFNHAGPQGRYKGPKPKHEGTPTSLKTSAKARRDTDVEEIMEIIARRYYGDYDEY